MLDSRAMSMTWSRKSLFRTAPVGLFGVLGALMLDKVIKLHSSYDMWGMTVLQDNSFRVGLNHALQLLDSREPPVAVDHLPKTDLDPTVFGNKVQLPVRWVLADDMVSWSANSIQN